MRYETVQRFRSIFVENTGEILFKVHINKLVNSRNWTMWKPQIELMLSHQEVLVCPDKSEVTATTEEKNTVESKRKLFYKNSDFAHLLLAQRVEKIMWNLHYVTQPNLFTINIHIYQLQKKF